MNLSGLLDFIKLKPKYYFVLSVLTGFILFIPSEWKELFHVKFDGIYNNIVGIVFLLSALLWLYGVGEFFYGKATSANKKRKTIERKDSAVIQLLKDLNNDEKYILSFFYYKDKKVLNMDVLDPIINNMCDNGILEIVYMPGTNSYTIGVGGTPVRINNEVRRHIKFEILDKQLEDGYDFEFTILEHK